MRTNMKRVTPRRRRQEHPRVKGATQVINPSRSERGWRGRRRIAVLVSIAAVVGATAVVSAGPASAANIGNCKAKLTPKGKPGPTATLKWTCDATARAYAVGSNRKIKSFGTPSAGASGAFLTCSGAGVGFGCGIADRAAPGTQPPGTTGWTSPVPPFPSATANPLTCGGFKRVAGTGTATDPNRKGIVGAPCAQVIPAGTLVTQKITLAADPCTTAKDPLQLYPFVGGEPPVTSFTVTGDSTTVGEFVSEPIPVSLKAFKGCSSSGKGKSGKKSATESAGVNNFPVNCEGSVGPATSGDQQLTFSCNITVRAWAVYSNKTIDIPGDEPLVTGTNGGGTNEGALQQCSGTLPGNGFGCGIVDRQTQSASLPNGQGVTDSNGVEQKFAFESVPCQRKGQPKTNVWLVVMGEPRVGGSAGEYVAAPKKMTVSGFGKCKGGKKGGGKKK